MNTILSIVSSQPLKFRQASVRLEGIMEESLKTAQTFGGDET